MCNERYLVTTPFRSLVRRFGFQAKNRIDDVSAVFDFRPAYKAVIHPILWLNWKIRQTVAVAFQQN